MTQYIPQSKAVVGLLFGFVITAVCGSTALVGATAYWMFLLPPLVCYLLRRPNPLWPIIAAYSSLLYTISYRIAGVHIDLPAPRDLRAVPGVLQIVVVNHPPTTLVPVPLRAINRDCGPLKVIVKGSFLLWPFIGLGGWAIGGFALIVRAKARWARWLTRLTLWLSVVVCRRNGTTLVILVDGHRPTRKRRAKLAARYPDGTPMGDVLRRLHRLLPPRAGGLWMIMETAKRMGLPVKIIGYFTDYPVCPGGAQDVVQLGESAVVVDRQELPELVHCATQEELQTALNQIWLQVDERMR